MASTSTIAQGCFGKVYKEKYNDTWAAIKRVPHHFISQKDLERECEVYNKAKHPNIVKLLGNITMKDRKWVIPLEFIFGEDLETTIFKAAKSKIQLTPANRGKIIIGMCEGLLHLHISDIVHQDLKPENIMVEHGTHRAVIIDLGLAKFFRRGLNSAIDMGNEAYSPPEVLQIGSQRDQRSDVWAMGKIIAELCARIRLYTPSVSPTKIKETLRDQPYCSAVCRMVESDPSLRASMAGVILDIRRAGSIVTTAPVQMDHLLPPSTNRNIQNRSPSPMNGGARDPSPMNRGARDPSPMNRSPSPFNRDLSPHNRDPSPMNRSPSPFHRDLSPHDRDPSPINRSPSPFNQDQSPHNRDPSPWNRDQLNLNRAPLFNKDPSPQNRDQLHLNRAPLFNRDPPPQNRDPPPQNRDPSPRNRDQLHLNRAPLFNRDPSPQNRDPPPQNRDPSPRNRDQLHLNRAPLFNRDPSPQNRDPPPQNRDPSPRNRDQLHLNRAPLFNRDPSPRNRDQLHLNRAPLFNRDPSPRNRDLSPFNRDPLPLNRAAKWEYEPSPKTEFTALSPQAGLHQVTEDKNKAQAEGSASAEGFTQDFLKMKFFQDASDLPCSLPTTGRVIYQRFEEKDGEIGKWVQKEVVTRDGKIVKFDDITINSI